MQNAGNPLLSLLVFLVILPCCAEAADKPQPPDERAIRAVISTMMQDFAVPGAAVVVVKDDRVIYLEGHGVRDITSKKPVSPDTLFALASCSKAFAATTVACLVGDGRMSWDDPVRRYLPLFRLSDPLADREVTMRDLLCHRTGVVRHDVLWTVQPWSAEEFIRHHGQLRLDKPFRSEFGYNNYQFTAVGMAAGNAAGMKWEELLQRRIFDPLGMKTATVKFREVLKSADLAVPHRVNKGKQETIPHWDDEVCGGAGAIYASVRDLSAWLRFQLGEGNFEGKRLLAASALRETHTPQIPIRLSSSFGSLVRHTSTQLSYGLGWFIRDQGGRTVIEHRGTIDGFRAYVGFVPREKLGIAVVANMQLTPMPQVVGLALLDRFLGSPPQEWTALAKAIVRKDEEEERAEESALRTKRKPNTKPSLELAEYAGTFAHPAYGTIRIAVDRGKPMLQWGRVPLPLEHYHLDTFLVTGDLGVWPDVYGDRKVTFHLDGTAAVQSLTFVEQEFRRQRK